MRRIGLTVGLLVFLAGPATAQSMHDRPWQMPNPVLILDPYEDNRIDFKAVATDPRVKGMIHRAYHGRREDLQWERRIKEARVQGLAVGIYLLGLPGDPITQADLLIAAGRKQKVAFLALDIENLDPKRSMTPKDALRFIQRVKEQTGRYPALYINHSTYKVISADFAKPPTAFAGTPLWLARFAGKIGNNSAAIWPDYTIWQFQSELNCVPCPTNRDKRCQKTGDTVTAQPCYVSVPGVAPDMDINVFNGDERALRALLADAP